MGGNRIADQVRRGLIAAAKVAPVVAAIDASGCDKVACAAESPPCKTVPVTGTYGFFAVAMVYPYPFDAGSTGATAFYESQLCGAGSPSAIELALESCRKFCAADPRYAFDGKYSDTDKIVSCSTYDVGGPQSPPSCLFPTDVNCVAEYPPGATACDYTPPPTANPCEGGAPDAACAGAGPSP